MKHQTLDELKTVAGIEGGPPRPAMTRKERLERWADLLEREPERRLATLPGTEYQPILRRDTMRAAGSPLSVAFEDPVLRDEGLRDDSYGEARRFFDVSDWQLHEIVCYCHFGATVKASSAARLVRTAISEPRQPRMISRLRDSLAW